MNSSGLALPRQLIHLVVIRLIQISQAPNAHRVAAFLRVLRIDGKHGNSWNYIIRIPQNLRNWEIPVGSDVPLHDAFSPIRPVSGSVVAGNRR